VLGSVDWTNVNRDRDTWQDEGSTVMNCRVILHHCDFQDKRNISNSDLREREGLVTLAVSYLCLVVAQ
jgi:hypothetical protein